MKLKPIVSTVITVIGSVLNLSLPTYVASSPILVGDLVAHGGSVRIVTTKQPLKCRSGAGASFAVLDSFPRGSLLDVIAKGKHGEEEAVVASDNQGFPWFLVNSMAAGECFVKADSEFTRAFGYNLFSGGGEEFVNACVYDGSLLVITSAKAHDGSEIEFQGHNWATEGDLQEQEETLYNGSLRTLNTKNQFEWKSYRSDSGNYLVQLTLDKSSLSDKGELIVIQNGITKMNKPCKKTFYRK